MIVSATIILTLKLGHRTTNRPSHDEDRIEGLPDEEADAIIEPV